jgi:hypothetical protein
MAWLKCPNPKCRYSWESRVSDPRACPRCKWRLDYMRPAHQRTSAEALTPGASTPRTGDQRGL